MGMVRGWRSRIEGRNTSFRRVRPPSRAPYFHYTVEVSMAIAERGALTKIVGKSRRRLFGLKIHGTDAACANPACGPDKTPGESSGVRLPGCQELRWPDSREAIRRFARIA